MSRTHAPTGPHPRRLLMTCAASVLAAFFVASRPSKAPAAEIRVTTEQGAWLFETHDPQVEIRVGQNGRTVTVGDGADGRQITLDTQTGGFHVGPGQEIKLSLDGSRPFDLRRGGQVIVTVRHVPAAGKGDARQLPAQSHGPNSQATPPRTPSSQARPAPGRRDTDPQESGPVQRLYTVSRDGRLMRIEVRGRDVQVTPLLRLAAPFRTRGVLTEGLAMGPDGRLYAAVNVGVDFVNQAAATGQGGQGAESLLYRIDPQTGESERVGDMGHQQVDGLSFATRGGLCGVTSVLGGGDGAHLLDIDADTGQARSIGENLPLEDLDCVAVVSGDRALVVDGMGLRDAFYEVRLDGRQPPRRLAATPNIIAHSRDLEGLTLGRDGFLYAFTGPDAGPDARVHLLRIDPRTFEHTDLGLMEFGAYCLAAESGAAPVRPATAPATSSNSAAEAPATAEKPKVDSEIDADSAPSARLTAAVTGPPLAGLPLQLKLGITNTGGGPARYPGAHPFHVAVTDSQGRTRTLPLSNGQYVQGSGIDYQPATP